MITFLEFKKKSNNDNFQEIKAALKKDGIVVIKLTTDENKVQIKQFDQIKNVIGYKPDKNLKFYINNSNNFVIVDTEKFNINEI